MVDFRKLANTEGTIANEVKKVTKSNLIGESRLVSKYPITCEIGYLIKFKHDSENNTCVVTKTKLRGK